MNQPTTVTQIRSPGSACSCCEGAKRVAFNRHGTLGACGRCRGSGLEPAPCDCGCGILYCRNCNAACGATCTCPHWLVQEESYWVKA